MKRLALQSALVVILATGCGSVAEAVEVTGDTGVPLQVPGQWSGDAPEGAGIGGLHLRGTVYRMTYGLSDERVNGECEVLVNIDFEVQGETVIGDVWGTATITNDRGTWEGSVTGTTSFPKGSPVHTHRIEQTLLGAGEYEGLRFVEVLEGTDFPWTITGRIEPID